MINNGNRKVAGRYDGDRSNTRMPDGGVARPQEPGRRRGTRKRPGDPSRIAVGAVPDPWGRVDERIAVAINRDVDVLEQERSAGRISEAAYLTGRIAQAAFERGTGVGSSNWGGGSRVDAPTAHEMAIGHAVDSAKLIVRIVGRMERAVGKVGARLLRAIITDGVSFKAAAAARGQTSERAATYAGDRFRSLLEDLAVEWQAEGKTGAQIVASLADEHDGVATEPRVRQQRAPIAASRSESTAGLGRRALDAVAGPHRVDRVAAVRRGMLRGR